MIMDKTFTTDDLVIINKWLKEHGHPECLPEDLPEFGYVAYDEEGPIAAGGISFSKGNLGVIDSYVTNPKRDSKTRHDALALITQNILKKAKENGIKKIISWTKDDGIIKRGIVHGFKAVEGHTLLVKYLQNEGV